MDHNIFLQAPFLFYLGITFYKLFYLHRELFFYLFKTIIWPSQSKVMTCFFRLQNLNSPIPTSFQIFKFVEQMCTWEVSLFFCSKLCEKLDYVFKKGQGERLHCKASCFGGPAPKTFSQVGAGLSHQYKNFGIFV